MSGELTVNDLDKAFRDAAEQDPYPEIQVDECAIVSRGDGEGAYVQAWIWVPAEIPELINIEEETNE